MAAEDPTTVPSPHEPGTLGHLLAGTRAAACPPESEWATLLDSIGRGDQAALYALYERTHRLVFTLMMRMSGERETAEELTVDVFHDVWRRAATYEPAGGTVLGWIMNQARHRAIDRLRHDGRQKRGVGMNVAGVETLSATDGAVSPMQAADRTRLLAAAIEKLSTDERHAIETAFFATDSYREAAERLQQPLGTVKTRIRSALAKLRGVLAPNKEAL